MDRESILELVSSVSEFNEIHEFMHDEDVDLALATIIKLVAKPDVPYAAAQKLVVQTQALASKFASLSKYYVAWGLGKAGTDGNRKKEVYFTLSTELEKLSNSLKYLTK